VKFSTSIARSPEENLQRRLLFLAASFLLFSSIALTFAPAVRYHTLATELRWQHWIGYAVWLFGFSILYRQADEKIPGRDPFILPVISLMVGWGLLTLFRLDPTYGFKQTIWLAVCLIGMIIGLRIPSLLTLLRRYKYIWLSLALILTLLTFFFGTNPSGVGPNLWLGYAGIYLQPSEILKLVLVIYLAAYLADSVPARFKLMQLLIPTLLVAGAALMILVVQRDLGTASLFIALYTVVIYIASGKRRFLLISFLVILASLVLGYYVFDVIEVRVEGWLNPWLDANGRSYQIVQSIIAIANGGIFGRGIGLGSPGVVPVSQSDFIFPSIIEESGLLGAVGIVLLYAILTLKGFLISLKAINQFQRFLAAGITTYLISQTLLIMGGTIRLLPLTGVTLPFFSYGGSSLITAFFAILLLLLISNQKTDEPTLVVQSRAYMVTGSVFLAALIIVALMVSWWTVVRAEDLLSRNDNPRRFISDQYVQRGKIFDRNNTILAESIGAAGDLSRALYYPSLSSVVGYTNSNYGQGGLEASMDSFLRGVEGNDPNTILTTRLLYAQYPVGADIRLSLDVKLQETADALLNGKTGAAVMINANTGEILVMSTSPTFDANALEENWETWKVSESAPLLNRATQGQYPAGAATSGLLYGRLLSTRSLPPIVSNLEWSSDLLSRYFCAVDPGVDSSWANLVISGCTQSTAMLEYYLGTDEVANIYRQMGFFDDSSLSIIEDETTFFDPTQDGTTLKEGEHLLVSPLQMAVAYSALSNGGIKITPQLAMAYRYQESDWVLLSSDVASTTTPELDVLQTSLALGSSVLPGWSITAAAQNQSSRLDWFIAGTQADWRGTPIVIVIALEDASPLVTRIIGQELFNNAVNSFP